LENPRSSEIPQLKGTIGLSLAGKEKLAKLVSGVCGNKGSKRGLPRIATSIHKVGLNIRRRSPRCYFDIFIAVIHDVKIDSGDPVPCSAAAHIAGPQWRHMSGTRQK
jgi:hypothetical protein